MLVNLKAEMARYSISIAAIGQVLGKEARAVKRRIDGKVEISGDDIKVIRDTFFPDCTLDYLLEEEPSIPLRRGLTRKDDHMSA